MSASRRPLFRFGTRPPRPEAAGGPPSVTLARAVEIARTRGLLRATEAVCDARAWKIEGFDAAGQEITVEIDPVGGRVLRVARGG